MGIGGLQAFRDSGIAFNASGKPLYTFIYFPQGKKATTMAVCYSKTGAVNALQNCEKVASGIKISGAKVYDLVPSSSYASSLSSTLNSVSKSEQAGYATMTEREERVRAGEGRAPDRNRVQHGRGQGEEARRDAVCPAGEPPDRQGALRDRRGVPDARFCRRGEELLTLYGRVEEGQRAEAGLQNAISELEDLGYSVS